MRPLDAIKTGFARAFQFSGRSTRSEFWWYIAFVTITLTIVSQFSGVVVLAALLILGLPTVSVGYRRLQDVSEDGYLIALPVATYAILWLIGNGPYLFTLSNGTMIGIGTSSPSFSLSIWSFIILAMTACSVLLCYRLTWASDPGSNPFGPNPTEVPS